MKTLLDIRGNDQGHWVGDGFPVRTLFSYSEDPTHLSPFLLLDYGGPYRFDPATTPRGVGQHPHRGFETVTIVYGGEVSHRDSAGGGGTIGTGDVQWMTAAGGILHEEFHSEAFTKSGGVFHMVQLWVNLPAKDKGANPGYQAITAAEMGKVTLAGGAGNLRVIAGDFAGTKGPASTFTPINMWDANLNAGARVMLPLPKAHNALVVVIGGAVEIGGMRVADGQFAVFSAEGTGTELTASEDAKILILTGEPLGEPVVGHGPFVMNTRAEIVQAMQDFQAGKFGAFATVN